MQLYVLDVLVPILRYRESNNKKHFTCLQNGWLLSVSAWVSFKTRRILHLNHSDLLEMGVNRSKNPNKRLFWTSHRPRWTKSTPETRVFGPLPNKRNDLSIRNRLSLYKQFIRLKMYYDCTVWRSTASNHIRRLQVLQSKRLRVGVPWYVSNL